jgi:hypothetical protein
VRRLSLVSEANKHVPFLTACRWAGVYSGESRGRGCKVQCLHGCGPSLRVWEDHAWCFSCRTYFSPVSLLAEKWRLSWDDAALKALNLVGWVPATYAHLWDEAQREPDPDRGQLGKALVTWCEASCPDWVTRQYDHRVAAKLSQCLGLLPRVRTADDCLLWLERCKQAMSRVLNADWTKDLDPS